MNKIRLNLPAHRTGELPDPNAAIVYINDVPLFDVTDVHVKCGDGETITTISVIGEVTGEVAGAVDLNPTH